MLASSTPQSKNAVFTFQITCRVLCFVLENSWWADDHSSSITKGSIYYIKHMYIQPFSMEVDWQEISHQMDVSTMFYICRCCVFTLWGRNAVSLFVCFTNCLLSSKCNSIKSTRGQNMKFHVMKMRVLKSFRK